MTHGFNSAFFSGNRARLLERLGGDPLVVMTANGVVQRSADTTLPFTQDKSFWYVSGVDLPDAVIVFTASTSFIILPVSNSMKDVFDGAVDPERTRIFSGVHEVVSATDGWQRLKQLVANDTQLYTLLPAPAYDSPHGFYRNPARQRLARRLRRTFPGRALYDAREAVARLRVHKQPEELAAITQAVAITTGAIDAVRSSSVLQHYAHEYELEAALAHHFRKNGATGHAYSPIVASGVNATTLHYIANNARIKPKDLLVVDVGAEVGEYAADITRTLAKTKPSQRQQAVVSAVRDVQQYAFSLLKPGLLLKDYERAVARAMGEQLKRLGLIVDAADSAAVRHYYPHATSHFLGLDVHDVGFYTEPLSQGMVLTCEPGIYIPEEGIGVRLEDDIVITKTGAQNLSEHCSYDAHVL